MEICSKQQINADKKDIFQLFDILIYGTGCILFALKIGLIFFLEMDVFVVDIQK